MKVGLHQIFCTEYCGDSHSRMLAKAVVLEPADFELWVKAQNNFDAETAYAGDVTKLGGTGGGGCAGCPQLTVQRWVLLGRACTTRRETSPMVRAQLQTTLYPDVGFGTTEAGCCRISCGWYARESSQSLW